LTFDLQTFDFEAFQDCTTFTPLTSHPYLLPTTRNQELFSAKTPPRESRQPQDTLSTRLHRCALFSPRHTREAMLCKLLACTLLAVHLPRPSSLTPDSRPQDSRPVFIEAAHDPASIHNTTAKAPPFKNGTPANTTNKQQHCAHGWGNSRVRRNLQSRERKRAA